MLVESALKVQGLVSLQLAEGRRDLPSLGCGMRYLLAALQQGTQLTHLCLKEFNPDPLEVSLLDVRCPSSSAQPGRAGAAEGFYSQAISC